MPRPLRIEYEHAFYHVMNRGRGGKTLFHSDAYYEAFLITLAEACWRFHAVMHAYCLMGNHYHLLIETPEANLGRIMRHINGVFTQRYNRLSRTDGPQFRGRYKAIIVDEDAYLLPLSRYIHRNPLDTRRPLVRNLPDYRWSSYPGYINQAPCPPWLFRDRIYAALGHRQRYAAYRQYIEVGFDEAMTQFYGKGNMNAVLGGQAFREQVAGRQQAHDESDVREVLRERSSLAEIVDTIARAFLVTPNQITAFAGRGAKANVPRKVAMYYCQDWGGMSLKAIAQSFGLRHVGGVSSAITSAKAKLAEKDLATVALEIEKRLNKIKLS